jgi:predicted MFS family arabinose efflux permease
MNLVVTTYFVYLVISVLLTVWVARTLHKGGRVFLVDVFQREDLADSVNHLLVVGFYLVNLGFIAMFLKYGDKPTDLREAIEFLASKVGIVLLVLGAMHFFNIFIFSRMRARAMLYGAPPPVSPDGHVGLNA